MPMQIATYTLTLQLTNLFFDLSQQTFNGGKLASKCSFLQL